MGDLARGAHDLTRGFQFLSQHPRLWRWVLGPAVISLVLLGILVLIVAQVATHVTTAVTAHLPSAIAGVAGTLLVILVIAVLAAGALLVFVSVAGLISGPFCERLSEAVEEILTGTPAPPFRALHYAKELGRGAGHAVRRIFSAVLGAIFLFALSFVPVVGTIVALALGYYFAASASAYDCYDSVLGRRELAYRDKQAFLRAHRSRSLGLGAAVAALLLVPLVNIVALGVGCVGATLAVHEFSARAAAARA